MKFSIKNSLLLVLVAPFTTYAFDSGSTGADGAFNPVTDIELQLPPSGIFNYTTVNIPAGVTVTFAKNEANTPVTLLASDDVIIDGTIDINGEDATIDGREGQGGPGGFRGGRGGFFELGLIGETGKGPGGGRPGRGIVSGASCGGGGGGYATVGGNGATVCRNVGVVGGNSYGSSGLLPLFGGSGGGGAAGTGGTVTVSGGGGGGAILIASSTQITIQGSIVANGGNGNDGGSGGGGSGGAIRLVASTISGEGIISANGGVRGTGASRSIGGNGAAGRIRLEAENMLRSANTSPTFSFGGPAPVFVPNLPTINITSVAGITAPATPTGTNDVVLPANTPNPISIVFATSDIPTGGTITLTATPISGDAISADSTPIAADGTATVSINLPNGPNLLIASTTFNVTASLGQDFSKYAQGEQVDKVRVGINAEGQSETTFITVSGKEFTFPSNAIAMN